MKLKAVTLTYNVCVNGFDDVTPITSSTSSRPIIQDLSEGREVKLGELKHHVYILCLKNKWFLQYKAYCAGNIITEKRVLSSSHCFYTNRKRYRRNFKKLKVVGGILSTLAQHPVHHSVQQWRSIKHVYSQKYFRFPAYNLAVVEIDKPWIFNQFVNKIPYATEDHDFDGVCEVITVHSVKSWARSKQLFIDVFKMVPKKLCERTLLRDCLLYYCTAYDSRKMTIDSADTEGGGLICHGTGDPAEVDESQGILVGITSLINVKLPILHHKVGIFHKWVTDSGSKITLDFMWVICLLFNKLLI